MFRSPSSASGHVEEPHAHYTRIGKAGGAKFWFHGLCNAFITVAERELMLPRSLTSLLVNHARPGDVTEGYAADWTVEQLREPAQAIADWIDTLTDKVRRRIARPRFIGSYNERRLHSALGYMIPNRFEEEQPRKPVKSAA